MRLPSPLHFLVRDLVSGNAQFPFLLVPVLLAGVAPFSHASNSVVMEKRFDTMDDVRVVLGNADVSRVGTGHANPSALAVADPVGPPVVATIGEPFPVEPDHTYLLHAWMRPDAMAGWQANLAVEWLNPDGRALGDLVTPVAHTSRSRPHVCRSGLDTQFALPCFFRVVLT
jgi:hypothetical protein